MNFREWLEEERQDPEFCQEWEAGEPAFPGWLMVEGGGLMASNKTSLFGPSTLHPPLNRHRGAQLYARRRLERGRVDGRHAHPLPWAADALAHRRDVCYTTSGRA
jgi:hypothetical protein